MKSFLRTPTKNLSCSAASFACAFALTVSFGFVASVAAQTDGGKPVAKPAASGSKKPAAAPEKQDKSVSPAVTPPPVVEAGQSPVPNGGEAGSPFAAFGQAQKIGVAACLPMLDNLLKLTIDTKNSSVTNWHNETPDQRMVTAYSFFNNENPIAPRSLALSVVSPAAQNKCDGTALRVQPSKLSCDEIAGNVSKQPGMSAPQKVEDSLVYPPAQTGMRLMLMPLPASGCLVISTGVYYAK